MPEPELHTTQHGLKTATAGLANVDGDSQANTIAAVDGTCPANTIAAVDGTCPTDNMTVVDGASPASGTAMSGQLLPADTIICRCEEVTLSEVQAAIDRGCHSLAAVKRYTRAGMGPCQGRSCAQTIADMISRTTAIAVADIHPDRPRFPLVPVTIDALSGISLPEMAASPPLVTQSRTRQPHYHAKTRVAVIGGGYHGLSIAWQLARAGVETVLVERNEIGTGASGNNFGCVQLQDSNPGLSYELNCRGFERMRHISDELGTNIDYCPMDSLLYAQNAREYHELEQLVTEKRAMGLDVRLLASAAIHAVEPHISTATLRGASYFRQARINPFKYLFALAGNGRQAGLSIMEGRKVERILSTGGACTGIQLAGGGKLEADHVVVAAGAWTPAICATCGVRVPVQHVIGEAFVTEALQPHIMSFISSASFFTTTHGSGGPAASFTAGQTSAGNILIGETSEPGPHDPDAATQLTSAAHCREMPRLLAQLYPRLASVPVLRSWTTCSPSTVDFEPILGFARDGVPSAPDGLIIAAGFKSSVVISSVVGEIVRDLVQRGRSFCDLAPFTAKLS
jgi:sarcosine oxidase subunit beta